MLFIIAGSGSGLFNTCADLLGTSGNALVGRAGQSDHSQDLVDGDNHDNWGMGFSSLLNPVGGAAKVFMGSRSW